VAESAFVGQPACPGLAGHQAADSRIAVQSTRPACPCRQREVIVHRL